MHELDVGSELITNKTKRSIFRVLCLGGRWISIDYFSKLKTPIHCIILRTWLPALLMGFLIGIITYTAWHYVNFFIFNSHSLTTSYQITYFNIESLIIQFITIALVTLIALFIPTNRYCIALCKTLVLFIGIYGGIVSGTFIESGSNAYLSLIYLGIQLFSIIWLLAIGISPLSIIDKIKIALIPFLLLLTVSLLPIAV